MSDEAKLNFVKDGPIKLMGEIEIVDTAGITVKIQQSTSLCRCGNSGNKPYCDGSHARTGFKAPPDLDGASN